MSEKDLQCPNDCEYKEYEIKSKTECSFLWSGATPPCYQCKRFYIPKQATTDCYSPKPQPTPQPTEYCECTQSIQAYACRGCGKCPNCGLPFKPPEQEKGMEDKVCEIIYSSSIRDKDKAVMHLFNEQMEKVEKQIIDCFRVAEPKLIYVERVKEVFDNLKKENNYGK